MTWFWPSAEVGFEKAPGSVPRLTLRRWPGGVGRGSVQGVVVKNALTGEVDPAPVPPRRKPMRWCSGQCVRTCWTVNRSSIGKGSFAVENSRGSGPTRTMMHLFPRMRLAMDQNRMENSMSPWVSASVATIAASVPSGKAGSWRITSRWRHE